MPKTYKHLCLEEREHIAILKGKGESLRAIARILNRHPSCISREIQRNALHQDFCPPNYYLGHKAHQRATLRNSFKHMRPRLKNPQIERFVLEKIQSKWSPEQIACSLPYYLPGYRLSYETIYQYIYKENRNLIPLLVRAHRKRHQRSHSRQYRKSHIPQRVSITRRPRIVQARRQAGHWETDTAVSRASLSALHVLVERKSRLIKISKLPQNTAAHSRIATNRRLCKLPSALLRTLTYDNGSENAQHMLVNKTLGTKSFFCNPYHSWEKGTVENSIGLIRRFFPKKTDFANIPVSSIKRVETLLNNRPRKCLRFRTPLEIFQKSVALAG